MKVTARVLPDVATFVDEEVNETVVIFAGTKPERVALEYSATESPTLFTILTEIPLTSHDDGGLLKFPILTVKEVSVSTLA